MATKVAHSTLLRLNELSLDHEHLLPVPQKEKKSIFCIHQMPINNLAKSLPQTSTEHIDAIGPIDAAWTATLDSIIA